MYCGVSSDKHLKGIGEHTNFSIQFKMHRVLIHLIKLIVIFSIFYCSDVLSERISQKSKLNEIRKEKKIYKILFLIYLF